MDADLVVLKAAINRTTPVLEELFVNGRTRRISRLVQELRYLGRTADKATASAARRIVPVLLNAQGIELEVNDETLRLAASGDNSVHSSRVLYLPRPDRTT